MLDWYRRRVIARLAALGKTLDFTRASKKDPRQLYRHYSSGTLKFIHRAKYILYVSHVESKI